MSRVGPSRLTPERLKTWRLLLETYDAVVDLLEDELMRQQGFPLTWYDVLVQLNEAPGGRLRMVDLADALLVSRSGLTRLVDAMERADLIRRHRSTSDRRVINVELRPAGRERMRGAWPVLRRMLEEHFSRHLTDGEVRVLGSALSKIAAAARTARAAARRPSRVGAQAATTSISP